MQMKEYIFNTKRSLFCCCFLASLEIVCWGCFSLVSGFYCSLDLVKTTSDSWWQVATYQLYSVQSIGQHHDLYILHYSTIAQLVGVAATNSWLDLPGNIVQFLAMSGWSGSSGGSSFTRKVQNEATTHLIEVVGSEVNSLHLRLYQGNNQKSWFCRPFFNDNACCLTM